jgi:hypothetical protein
MPYAVSITPGGNYTTYAVIVPDEAAAIVRQRQELAKDPEARVTIAEVKNAGDE